MSYQWVQAWLCFNCQFITYIQQPCPSCKSVILTEVSILWSEGIQVVTEHNKSIENEIIKAFHIQML